MLVCGDDREARAQVIALAQDAGMRAFHAGPLANSVVAEALTSVLITINRQYKVKHPASPSPASRWRQPMPSPAEKFSAKPAAEVCVSGAVGNSAGATGRQYRRPDR